MSMHPFSEDVIFLQRFLKSAGFYAGALDSVWGAQTDTAMNNFQTRSQQVAEVHGLFDPYTEKNLISLHLKAQQAARVFLAKALRAGIQARIISGTRSYAKQEELYKKGRFGDHPSNIVTYARGGASNHNFGIAWDVGIFQNGEYLQETPLYERVAQIGLTTGLEWGGNWTKLKDRPHYQLATGLRIQEVRSRFESGESYL